MAKDKKTFQVGRDALTGRFVTIKKAEKNPERYIVERLPKPGYADTQDALRPRPPRGK